VGRRPARRREFRARDAALAGFGAHDEVVLWFEHDLYDQLQLAAAARLLRRPRSAAPRG
jgi:hypothetical protein